MWSVECFFQRRELVRPCEHHVEESDDATFKFSTLACVDGCRAQSLPNNVFTDVGGNEERNARSESISFLQQLVEDDDNDSSEEELHDDENCIASAKVSDVTIHPTDHVG